MNALLPALFAAVAAVGNAMFALGQRQSQGSGNGLLFVGLSALIACFLAFLTSPLMGSANPGALIRDNARWIGLSGTGLFMTYLGFNLLYSRYGAAPYVLYAAMSIVTTTVIVGFWFLRESMNLYHVGAIVASLAAVVLFSLGQAKG